MPKMFVISDVHSYYNEMQKALDEAGFDPENKEHVLISCGDEWDRGKQPLEVMKFFNSLERKVIIKGNHTQLFEDLCLRGYPMWYDRSNGTKDTVQILGQYKLDHGFDLCCERAWNYTKVFRSNMVNYFETQNYIFVHSWIPTITQGDDCCTYNKNWRNASQKEWDAAMWNNPFKMAERGLNQTGKTIVFGHWHCSTGWAKDEERSEFGPDAEWSLYYGDGIIGIDRCTAHTGECNVLVITDEFI